MTDIVDKLSKYIAGMGTRKPEDYIAFLTVDEAMEAIETIQNLRQALHRIGYDYVELSHDKVQWLYHDHMKIAKKAYQDSFPPEPEKKPEDIRPFDDNF